MLVTSCLSFCLYLDKSKSVDDCRQIHHLLRKVGEFHLNFCFNLPTWDGLVTSGMEWGKGSRTSSTYLGTLTTKRLVNIVFELLQLSINALRNCRDTVQYIFYSLYFVCIFMSTKDCKCFVFGLQSAV